MKAAHIPFKSNSILVGSFLLILLSVPRFVLVLHFGCSLNDTDDKILLERFGSF